MGILSRYIFRQTAGAMVLILVSLTGVVWIAVALRQIELMTTQGQDVLRFLSMTTLAIPSMMALIAPIALLIASIHVLNRLNSDSELIVMTAGGMPAWSLLKPLAMLALLVSVGIAVVNHLAGPWAQQKLKELVVQVRTDLMAQVIQPWRFTSPEAKLTVHIRDRSPSGELLGLMMHDARDPKQIVTYLAEKGRIIKQNGAAYLRMDNGHIIRRLDNEATPQIIAFDRYAVDLNRLEQRADQVVVVRPRERYTTELLKPDPNDPVFKLNPGSYTSELHERLASPLYTFAFVLLVLAFMGQAQTTRTSRMRAVIIAFAVAVFYRVVGISGANYAVVHPNAVPLLYVSPACAAVTAAMMTQWRLYPRGRSRAVQAIAMVVERLRTAAGALLPRRPSAQALSRTGVECSVHAPSPLCCQALPAGDLGCLRGMRRAHLHDRHDRAAAAFAARNRSVPMATLLWMGLLRLPAFTEILLAFAVLVGSIGALLSLNRKSELIVMRAGGMSVWQFLRPGLTVSLLLGIFAVTVYNPLAAAARSEAERLLAEAFGREASLLATSGEGSWLRQDGADGQSVMSARAVADQGLSLTGVIVFQFDPQGRFVERIDADQGHRCSDGYWELQKAPRSPAPVESPELSTPIR